MSSIIEALRLRRKERVLSSEERFRSLAADIWSGKKISEDAVEKTLSECGKTDTNLEHELSRLDAVAAHKAKLVDEESIMTELRQLSLNDQQAETEYTEFRKQWSTASEQRKARSEYLRRLLTDSRKAETELHRLVHESDVCPDNAVQRRDLVSNH